MSWFKRENGDYESGPGAENVTDATGKTVRTEGLWIKCLGCRAVIWKAELEANLNVCPKCQHHFKMGAQQRIDLLLEPGYELVDLGLRSTDPLNFTDVKPYKQRLRKAQEATGLNDAIINAVGQLGLHSVVVSAMEYGFIGGSMGAVVGETIARAVDRARTGRKPLIIIAASGGARMMEGVVEISLHTFGQVVFGAQQIAPVVEHVADVAVGGQQCIDQASAFVGTLDGGKALGLLAGGNTADEVKIHTA